MIDMIVRHRVDQRLSERIGIAQVGEDHKLVAQIAPEYRYVRRQTNGFAEGGEGFRSFALVSQRAAKCVMLLRVVGVDGQTVSEYGDGRIELTARGQVYPKIVAG